MPFPVRCFTCGKPISSLHPKYRAEVEAGTDVFDALDSLKIARMCCRRMFLGYDPTVDDALALYPTERIQDLRGLGM